VGRENAVDFAGGVFDHAGGDFFVVEAAHTFEDVTEGAVPQIVKKSGREAEGFFFFRDFKRPAELLDHFARGFHDAEAVAVAGMIGAGIGEAGKAKLADAAKPLELGGIDQTEE